MKSMEMSNDIDPGVRHGEAFWRKLHEAWKRNAWFNGSIAKLTGMPLRPFGIWRAKFKPNPRAAPAIVTARKLKCGLVTAYS
jgi:hypothetical protein